MHRNDGQKLKAGLGGPSIPAVGSLARQTVPYVSQGCPAAGPLRLKSVKIWLKASSSLQNPPKYELPALKQASSTAHHRWEKVPDEAKQRRVTAPPLGIEIAALGRTFKQSKHIPMCLYPWIFCSQASPSPTVGDSNDLGKNVTSQAENIQDPSRLPGMSPCAEVTTRSPARERAKPKEKC